MTDKLKFAVCAAGLLFTIASPKEHPTVYNGVFLSEKNLHDTEKQKNEPVAVDAHLPLSTTGLFIKSRKSGYLSSSALTMGDMRVERLMNSISEDDMTSLVKMLVSMVTQEMKDCSLVIAFDDVILHWDALKIILELPNPKQIVLLKNAKDFANTEFSQSNCRGYILLWVSDVLVSYANDREESWDFQGKFIIVDPSRKELEQFVESAKGRKTPQIIGVTKSERPGEWDTYINWLYTDRPLRRTTTWKNGIFTDVDEVFFPNKFADLKGATLKVVTFEWEPSVLYFRDSKGEVDFPFGIDIEVVSALASVLNFTLKFVEPPPGELWGVAAEDGSWNGMVGELSKNEADIGVANLFLTLGRLGVVDYSAPYDAEVSCFLARTSPPNPKWRSLSLPFQEDVWVALLVGLFISGPLLFIFARASTRCGGERPLFQSLLFSGQYTFSMQFRQSQKTLPERTNTQIFVSFFWIYTIIITIAYGTNLTAFLTVVQTPSGIESIKELYQSRVEVSGLGGFFKGALASSVDPFLQGLAERFEAYGDLGLVWPKVLGGDAVYLHNKQFLEFVMATEFTTKGISSVRIMKECFSPYNIAMALQRNSPIKKKFDEVIGWMLQSGLVRRWFLESFRQSKKIQDIKKINDGAKDDEEGNREGEKDDVGSSDEGVGGGVIPLGIDHLQGGFFILVLGILCSVVIFGLEICFRI